MVYPGNVFETRSGMTILTYVRGAYMRCTFTRSVNTVMTARTISADGTVIKLSVIPAIGVVAVIAGFSTLNMISGLPLGDRPIVASAASTYNRIVINASYALET